MSASFDDELRQKFEGIRPEDTGLTFNREKVWERISSNPKNTRALPFKVWVTHAAAVAAGIFVGIWFFTKEQLVPPGNIVAKPVNKTIVQPSGTTEIITKAKDKVTPPTALPINPVTIKHQPSSSNAYATNNEAHDVNNIPENSTMPGPIAEGLVVAQQTTTTQPNKKTLHLADIMNENDHIVNTPEIRYKSVWARLIPEENNSPEDVPESFTMAVGNFIKNKRN